MSSWRDKQDAEEAVFGAFTMVRMFLGALALGAILLSGCTMSLGGGHVVIEVVCDPPVGVAVAYEPMVGIPEVVLWSYDWDLEEWLNEEAQGAAKDLVPILAAAAQAECEGLEF